MNALIIGGTGTISAAVSALAVERGWRLTLLNRGGKFGRTPKGASCLVCDINDESAVAALLQTQRFDVVADFVVKQSEHAERDVRLFTGKTDQYFFISTEAVYTRPPAFIPVDETAERKNRSYPYAKNKSDCEDVFLRAFEQERFPVTIVRPAHTYDDCNLPLDIVSGKDSTWPVLSRILRKKPVIVAGDGTSLWSMTHADDFAHGFLGLMGNPAAIGECVNLMTDEVLCWNSIYDTIGAALGVPANKVHVPTDFLVRCSPALEGPLMFDKAASMCFDTAKLKRLVPGFHASVRYAAGVRRCLDNILTTPALQIESKTLNRFQDDIISAWEKAFVYFDALHSKDRSE